MLRATAFVRRPAVKADRVVDTVLLDHKARARGVGELTTVGGLALGLDLGREVVLADGDALKLEDGRLVQVEAAPEILLKATAGAPARLLRMAWHLGDQHVAAEFGEDAIHVARDPDAAELLRGLGATLTEVTRAFRPEQGRAHHHHDHDHHGHGHEHHRHAHGDHHHHGPGCRHDHADGEPDAGAGHGAHGHRHG